MRLSVFVTQELSISNQKRLQNSFTVYDPTIPIDSFNLLDPYNCVLFKMAPINSDDHLTLQHVLNTAGIGLFAITIAEDHRGWFFLLPQYGHVLVTKTGILYMQPNFIVEREQYRKMERQIDKNVMGLDPEVYLPHSDFSIFGIDNGAMLLVARNTTTVVTQ